MAKAVRNPNIVYKVRDPETGLFLCRKGSSWSHKSWVADGAAYPTREKAIAIIEHYVLNTGDRKFPLEVVELRLQEVSATPHDCVPLDDLRAFYSGDGARTWSGGNSARDWIWWSLSFKGTVGGFAGRAVLDGAKVKYIAFLSGTHNPVKHLNLLGLRSAVSHQGRKRTFVALEDDAGLVALKLAHHDDIVQVWDFKKAELIEGEEWVSDV